MQDSGAIRIELDTVDGFISSASIRSSRPVGHARPVSAGRRGRRRSCRAGCSRSARARRARRRARRSRSAGRAPPGGDAALEAIGVLGRARLRIDARLPARLALGARAARPSCARPARRCASAAAAAQTLAGAWKAISPIPAKLAGARETDPAPPRRWARRKRIRQPDTVSPRCFANARASAMLSLSTPDALTALTTRTSPRRWNAIPRASPRGPRCRGAAGDRRLRPALARRRRPIATRSPPRLIARLADVRQTLAAIGELISRKDIGSEQAIVGGRTSSGAASARWSARAGGFIIWREWARDGRIAAYGILAPTDWNFHPAGPCVAATCWARGSGAERRRGQRRRKWRRIDRPLRRLRGRGEGICGCLRMHEMSLTESIVEIALEEARKNGARRVTRVFLDVGALSCVEPEALQFCFAAVSSGTPAEGAQLEIERIGAPAGASTAKRSSPLPSVSAPARTAGAFACR